MSGPDMNDVKVGDLLYVDMDPPRLFLVDGKGHSGNPSGWFMANLYGDWEIVDGIRSRTVTPVVEPGNPRHVERLIHGYSRPAVDDLDRDYRQYDRSIKA